MLSLSVMDKLKELRNRYLKINSYWDNENKVWTWTDGEKHLTLMEWELANGVAEEMMQNESDINKRKEIIDYLFADNVDEVWENYLRKTYL